MTEEAVSVAKESKENPSPTVKESFFLSSSPLQRLHWMPAAKSRVTGDLISEAGDFHQQGPAKASNLSSQFL